MWGRNITLHFEVGVSIRPKPIRPDRNRLTGKPKPSPDPTSPDSPENRSVGVGSVGLVGILVYFSVFVPTRPIPTVPKTD